MKNVAKKIF